MNVREDCGHRGLSGRCGHSGCFINEYQNTMSTKSTESTMSTKKIQTPTIPLFIIRFSVAKIIKSWFS